MDETQQFRVAVDKLKEHEGHFLHSALDNASKEGKEFRQDIENLLRTFNAKFLHDINDEEKKDIVKSIDRAMDVINDKGSENLDHKWIKETTEQLQETKKTILANM